MRPNLYRVVQPWGPDKARECTAIGYRDSASAAFALVDQLHAQMARVGTPLNYVELIVVDPEGKILEQTPSVH